MGENRWFLLACLLLAGCEAPRPAEVVAAPVKVSPPPVSVKTSPPMVALVEPYLVPVAPAQLVIPPPSLGGRIQMTPPPASPLVPTPPPVTQTRPIPTPPPSRLSPSGTPPVKTPAKPSPALVTAMVNLLQDERSRSVDQARRQLSLATTRVTQTAAEAKKTADLVRAGALAQFKSTQADAAARDAVGEQADAQKTLNDAQQRVQESRRDVESALNAISELPFSLAQLAIPPTAFRSVPFTYRLSILGSTPIRVVEVEGGTLGRDLTRGSGEAGAWIVRCADPSKLRVKVGAAEMQTIVRSLPRTDPGLPRA